MTNRQNVKMNSPIVINTTPLLKQIGVITSHLMNCSIFDTLFLKLVTKKSKSK